MAEDDTSKAAADGSCDGPPVSTSSWNPLGKAFRPYVSPSQSSEANSPESSSSSTTSLRVIVKRPVLLPTLHSPFLALPQALSKISFAPPFLNETNMK